MKNFWSTFLVMAFALVLQQNVNAQDTILGLTDGNSISQVEVVGGVATPGLTTAVTGLEDNDDLVGIDFRAGNGQIYALGRLNNVYTLNRTDFAASLVGNFADGDNDALIGLGGLSGNTFAFDFNPSFGDGSNANGFFCASHF